MKKLEIKDAGAEYAEIWGEAIHTNRHLRMISGGLAIAVLLLIVVVFRIVSVEPPRPIIVRVDEVGRAEAVSYEAMEAQADPLDPTTKYFLNRFIYDFISGFEQLIDQCRRCCEACSIAALTSRQSGPAACGSSAPSLPMPRFAPRVKMSPFSRRAERVMNCKSPASS